MPGPTKTRVRLVGSGSQPGNHGRVQTASENRGTLTACQGGEGSVDLKFKLRSTSIAALVVRAYPAGAIGWPLAASVQEQLSPS